jgi:hypothetical protein
MPVDASGHRRKPFRDRSFGTFHGPTTANPSQAFKRKLLTTKSPLPPQADPLTTDPLHPFTELAMSDSAREKNARQRVGLIVARVEACFATHGNDPLARRMRSRSSRRWRAIWSRAIEGFDRSLEDRQVKKPRVVRLTKSGEAGTANSGETPLPQEPPLVTVSEITTRQQNGRSAVLGHRHARGRTRTSMTASSMSRRNSRVTCLLRRGASESLRALTIPSSNAYVVRA